MKISLLVVDFMGQTAAVAAGDSGRRPTTAGAAADESKIRWAHSIYCVAREYLMYI